MGVQPVYDDFMDDQPVIDALSAELIEDGLHYCREEGATPVGEFEVTLVPLTFGPQIARLDDGTALGVYNNVLHAKVIVEIPD